MDAVVLRLHRSLVKALQARGADALDRPVTVAEIYQDLTPYRGVRDALGVEMNADYEHALLRLLAGEGDLVRLEPESAREELRRELESSNPYVGAYRNYAACDVWVSADRGGAAKAQPPQDPEAQPAARARETATGPAGPTRAARASAMTAAMKGIGRPEHAQAASDPAKKAAAPPEPDRASAQHRAACTFCSQGLPTGRAVRFCPHCGKDQRERPCPQCEEPLDRTWRFCIRCGTAASPGLVAASEGD